jgi:hypothetical protein
MPDLAKVAFEAWRRAGVLSTVLYPNYEQLSRADREQWDAVAQAVLFAINPPDEVSEACSSAIQTAEATDA